MLADLMEGVVVDWKLAMQEERAALKRIVALLFALADLAERAHRRSGPVCRFVVWILRPAESVARDFVVGRAEPPSCSMPAGRAGDADAMRLAADFRDLARELDRQARLAFAASDCIHDDAGQAGLARFGARRTLDADGLPNIPRRLAAAIAGPAACATGPPDTCLAPILSTCGSAMAHPRTSLSR